MENKVCSKCSDVKSVDDFHTCNGTPINVCKICKNKISKIYRDNNKNYFTEYKKKYEISNKENLTNYRKEFYSKYNKGGEFEGRRTLLSENNKNKIKESQKKYRDKNKGKIKIYMQNYGVINRKKLNEYSINYNKSKPYVKMWLSSLNNTLKRLNKKKEGHTIDLLGYSATELKLHIESLFTECMSWDNYGEWHIDHIKPISSFDVDTSMCIVNALSNLQPLWATTRKINGIIYIGNLNKNKY